MSSDSIDVPQPATGFEALKASLGASFDLVAEKNIVSESKRGNGCEYQMPVQPLLAAESTRSFKYTVPHVTVWRRK